jgi:glycosyltransferase involved in cell wall biosynthesis
MKILYVVNNAAFFHSHRLPIALAAREQGHQIVLLTGRAGSETMEAAARAELRRQHIPHETARFGSGGTSLMGEVAGWLDVLRIMRRVRPDLVHCASPKGVLYGGLAARLLRVPALVLSISGMGSLFTGQRGPKSWARMPYLALLRSVLAHPCCRVVVQNGDDRAQLLHAGMARDEQLLLVPGSGAPVEDLATLALQGREPLVVLPARLLRDKGVVEFVEAARRLRGRGWRFALVGTADYDNPTSLGEAQVRAWVDEGAVEWWGHRRDMREVYARTRIVCLPSYREGMPKVLLEAAAAGCAVVTTDTIGCREAIAPGRTGELVPVGDAKALADALRGLMDDPGRVQAFGEAGRALARERFDLRVVVGTTVDLYHTLHRASRATASDAAAPGAGANTGRVP